jgi:hypothetical protein
MMPFWKRLLITVCVMLAMSIIAGLVWNGIFEASLPSYLAGVIGGLSSLPTWEFLRRIRPKEEIKKENSPGPGSGFSG